MPCRAGRFLDEFEWYANALKTERERPCKRSECDGQALVSAN